MPRSLLSKAPLLLVLALVGVPASADAATKKPRAFKNCGELVRYARSQARDIAHPYGVPHLGDTLPVPGTGGPVPPPSADQGGGGGGGGEGGGGGGSPTQAPAAPTPGTDFSGTNVQEEGVDEPDLVKTDGRTMFVATGGSIRSFDVTAGTPRPLDAIQVDGYSFELVLHGQKLIAISEPGDESAPGVGTIIREIDVSDPARLRVTRIMQVEGDVVGARLTGGTFRVAISSYPDIEYPPAPEGAAPETTEQAEARVKRGIAKTRLRGWRPSYKLVNRKTGKRAWRALVPCDSVRRLGDFSGLGVLTVLTIDVDRGLPAVDSDAIYADADTVYASKDNLYLATERWVDPGTEASDVASGSATTIHKLGTSEPGRTDYRASGEVRGYLLSQWSLSEHEGKLRVATTDEPSWLIETNDDEPASESFVTVLDEQGGALRQIGRVGGLGKGEEIFAVRFIGTKGYVVTFRQTDPLYTLDLTDPADPKVLGELKILGYSAYLHPVGEDLLLGVGQDATERGEVRGVQLSLFDVSDPRRPRRLHQATLAGDSYSEAEWDHRAFLYWPATQTVVIPVSLYDDDEESSFIGAVGYKVDGASGITPVGRISHLVDPEDEEFGYAGSISRAVVVGDKLFTVSDTGLKASGLADFADVGFTPFE